MWEHLGILPSAIIWHGRLDMNVIWIGYSDTQRNTTTAWFSCCTDCHRLPRGRFLTVQPVDCTFPLLGGWVGVCWHSFQTEGWLADLMQPGAHEQTQWNMYEPSAPQQRTWGRWASRRTWRRTGWCWWSCRLYPDHRRSSAGSGSACFLWRERAAAAWRERAKSTEQLHCETVMHFYNTCISISTCVCVHYQCIVHTPLSSGLQHSPEKL